MAAKLARKARAADTAAEPPQVPVRASRPGTSAPRGSLDPLILALSRAVDRQAPARPSGPQDTRTD